MQELAGRTGMRGGADCNPLPLAILVCFCRLNEQPQAGGDNNNFLQIGSGQGHANAGMTLIHTLIHNCHMKAREESRHVWRSGKLNIQDMENLIMKQRGLLGAHNTKLSEECRTHLGAQGMIHRIRGASKMAKVGDSTTSIKGRTGCTITPS